MDPKFSVDINIAYMVPSIFLGHILHANMSKGIEFSSPITTSKIPSPMQNNLSGIPHYTLILCTRMIVSHETKQ
jgi:hypothetical protein